MEVRWRTRHTDLLTKISIKARPWAGVELVINELAVQGEDILELVLLQVEPGSTLD